MKKKQADNLEKAENADPSMAQSPTQSPTTELEQSEEDTHTVSHKSLALPDILRHQRIREALQQDFDEHDLTPEGVDEDATILDKSLIHQPATVNTFEDINWKDPFPRRSTQAKKDDINQDLYNEKAFSPFGAPCIIYLPSKLLMRKLMRICTECKNETELDYLV